MTLPTGTQLQYWGVAGVAFLAALWLLGDAVAPFLAGAAMAYFLNPLAERLVARGLPRTAAVVAIALAVAGLLAVAGFVVIPPIVAQAAALIEAAPEGFGQIHRFLEARFPEVLDEDSALRRALAGAGEALQSRAGALADGVVSSARGLVGVVIFLVVAPVVAFYLLLDWPRVLAAVDGMLPRDHAPTIRRLAGDIDLAVAGFVRGQITVCLILAVWYATALGLVGLQFGLVVGVVTGMISFIPWVGAILGGALSIGLALHQFWGSPAMIGLVVAVFAIGQFLEGNVLVPRLVGRSVGLHPVWLLFALSAFGTLFGFAGLLVAVPVAAALGVVVRFFAARYRDSPLYRGRESRAGHAPPSDPPSGPPSDRPPDPPSGPR